MIVLSIGDYHIDFFSEKNIVVGDYKRVSDNEIIQAVDIDYKDILPQLDEVEVEQLKFPPED